MEGIPLHAAVHASVGDEDVIEQSEPDFGGGIEVEGLTSTGIHPEAGAHANLVRPALFGDARGSPNQCGRAGHRCKRGVSNAGELGSDEVAFQAEVIAGALTPGLEVAPGGQQVFALVGRQDLGGEHIPWQGRCPRHEPRHGQPQVAVDLGAVAQVVLQSDRNVGGQVVLSVRRGKEVPRGGASEIEAVQSPRLAIDSRIHREAAAVDEAAEVAVETVVGPAFIHAEAVHGTRGAGRAAVVEVEAPCALPTLGLAQVDVRIGRGVHAKTQLGIAGVQPGQGRVHAHGQGRQGFNLRDGRHALGHGGVLNRGFGDAEVHALRAGRWLGDLPDFQFAVSHKGHLQAVLSEGVRRPAADGKGPESNEAGEGIQSVHSSVESGMTGVSDVVESGSGMDGGGFSNWTRRSRKSRQAS